MQLRVDRNEGGISNTHSHLDPDEPEVWPIQEAWQQISDRL